MIILLVVIAVAATFEGLLDEAGHLFNFLSELFELLLELLELRLIPVLQFSLQLYHAYHQIKPIR